MTGSRYQIKGHIFYSEKEYRDALRDDKLIGELRKKTDFRNKKQVAELYGSMQSGQITFGSVLGREFDDEVYEIYQKLKNEPAQRPGRKAGLRGRGKSGAGSRRGTKDTASRSGQGSKVPDYVEQEAKRILAAKDKRRRLLIAACGIVAAACIGYFGFYYFMAGRAESSYDDLAGLKEQDGSALPDVTVTAAGSGEDEQIVLTVLSEYKSLYNKNKSLIGWIKIDDTNIDYPVLQSPDPEYYLTHDFYQEYDKNGSIFLDPECDVVNRSTNLILYGHHMQSGKMFGSLDSYSSEKFFEDHRYITFDTIYEKGTYEVMYVFRSRIYNEDEIVFKYYQFIDVDSETEFYSNMNEMAAMSLYDTGVTAVYGDELLTLSTCDYQETNGRFVVVAKKIS